MAENEDDLVLIREILAREIDTINTYQRMLASARGPEVASFLTHIIDEEKEHVAEALELIKLYDPVQANLLQSANHWRANSQQIRPVDAQEKTLSDPGAEIEARSLTVGSLRDQNGRRGRI
jgi:rubrerythrin